MLKAEKDRKQAEDAERKRAEVDVLRPGRVFRDCPDVCPEMVVLPAGEFTMGSSPKVIAAHIADLKRKQEIFALWPSSEGPQREVTIARPFAVGKFEVTFDEWDACVAAGGCKHRPGDKGWGRGRRPVINVPWHDAKEYAAWLSRKTGKTYGLLTEAEWEYAARAGTTTRYAFGDTISKSQWRETGGKTSKTVEVGSFPANKFGLHDMHGNALEWVEDAWRDNYRGAPQDGSVWQGGLTDTRVVRGGYSALRIPLDPGSREKLLLFGTGLEVGFRLARTL